VTFRQIVNNGDRFKLDYPASVTHRPTRRKTIPPPVADDVASIRSAAFWYGQAKSDASIWRMTTGATYNPKYCRTATSALWQSPTRFLQMASCHSDKTLFVIHIRVAR
jgi:hypothetical protein